MDTPTKTETQNVVSTSAPTNPDVSATASRLAQLISGASYQTPSTLNENLFTGAGPTTQGAWALGKAAATDPNFTGSIDQGISTLGKTAAGDYVGSVDPNFEAALDRASNGLTADVNASIGADGRYGSNVHTQALTDQVGGMRTNAELANLQQQKQDQLSAIPALTALFSAKQTPAQIMGAIGGAEDANTQGLTQGRYDLQQRQQNALPDWIAKLTSAAAGNSANTGMTSNVMQTNTQPGTPWWLAGLSALGSIA